MLIWSSTFLHRAISCTKPPGELFSAQYTFCIGMVIFMSASITGMNTNVLHAYNVWLMSKYNFFVITLCACLNLDIQLWISAYQISIDAHRLFG